MKKINQNFIENTKDIYFKHRKFDREASGEISWFFISFMCFSLILYAYRKITAHFKMFEVNYSPELQLIICFGLALIVMIFKQIAARKKVRFYVNEAKILEAVNVREFINEYYKNKQCAEQLATVMYDNYGNELLKKAVRHAYKNETGVEAFNELEKKIDSNTLVDNPVALIEFLLKNENVR